jgi:hypothetical protein
MKKGFLIITLLFLSVLIAGCDYPEKSFRLLSPSDIPDEVTMDFELPVGYYAPFVWTSSDEMVLTIVDGHYANIIQQEIDVDVIITARINQQTERFVVKVLKTGSAPTLLERAIMALDQITMPQEAILPFEVPTEIDQIFFKYHQSSYYTNHYDMTTKLDGSIWVLPYLINSDVENHIEVTAYITNEHNQEIVLKTKTLTFNGSVDHESIHPHLQVYQALDIMFAEGDSQHHVTQSFTLPLTSSHIEDAVISWSIQPGQGLIIDTDGKTVYLTKESGTHATQLTVSITIDALTYHMNYPITIKFDS